MDTRQEPADVCLPKAVMENNNLPFNAVKIYYWMLDYSRKEGRCWPSETTLANKVGISERQVRANIDILCAEGLIVRIRRGKRETNIYIPTCLPATMRPKQVTQASPTPAGDRRPSSGHLVDEGRPSSGHEVSERRIPSGEIGGDRRVSSAKLEGIDTLREKREGSSSSSNRAGLRLLRPPVKDKQEHPLRADVGAVLAILGLDPETESLPGWEKIIDASMAEAGKRGVAFDAELETTIALDYFTKAKKTPKSWLSTMRNWYPRSLEMLANPRAAPPKHEKQPSLANRPWKQDPARTKMYMDRMEAALPEMRRRAKEAGMPVAP